MKVYVKLVYPTLACLHLQRFEWNFLFQKHDKMHNSNNIRKLVSRKLFRLSSTK